MIEVWVSKGAAALAKARGWPIKMNDNVLDPQVAMDVEADMWDYYQDEGGTPSGRAAASLSRSLATAIEATRPIEQVWGEIRTVLTGKWDDEDAVEQHVQLMVHRGWGRDWALQAIKHARMGD